MAHRAAATVVRLAAAISFACTSLVQAQGITKRQADEILKELKAIHQLLERQQGSAPRTAFPPPPTPDERVSVQIAPGGHAIGRADAPLTLVEYTDYQCPYCREFHLAAFDQIRKNWIDTGKLRYLSRDFPLDFHENAMRAAQAARCAGEQGRFWELRHVMIVNASQLKPENLLTYATDLRLDVEKFRGCLDSNRYRQEVEIHMAEGQRAGVSGTPAFVLGRMSDGRIDGVRLMGAMPYAMFESRLEEMLKRPPAK